KPSRGRISYAPIGDTPGGIGTNGPLARTVADAAAFLDVTSGYVLGDPYWLPNPDPSFLQMAHHSAKQGPAQPLKVAYVEEIKPFGAVHPTCHQAVMTTVQRLSDLGHQVEEMTLDCSALVDPFTVVFRACLAGTGVPIEAMSPMNQWLISHNDSAGNYFAALWQMQMISRQLVTQFYPYDVVVMPVYTHPQIRVGEWADLSPDQAFDQVAAWIAPCPLFNATGQPAIALPTGLADTGLPTGVQLVGRPGDESTLIAVAAQLEAHHPWIHHAATIESRW
ncbi:MAG: amidase family protein, partial [Leptolyngbyaceae bacterium]|nr:amidase family protein [Leptolyngbyaceae bacterium]